MHTTAARIRRARPGDGHGRVIIPYTGAATAKGAGIHRRRGIDLEGAEMFSGGRPIASQIARSDVDIPIGRIGQDRAAERSGEGFNRSIRQGGRALIEQYGVTVDATGRIRRARPGNRNGVVVRPDVDGVIRWSNHCGRCGRRNIDLDDRLRQADVAHHISDLEFNAILCGGVLTKGHIGRRHRLSGRDAV